MKASKWLRGDKGILLLLMHCSIHRTMRRVQASAAFTLPPTALFPERKFWSTTLITRIPHSVLITKGEEDLLHFNCSPSILDYFLFLHFTGGVLTEELSTSAASLVRNTKSQVGTTQWPSQRDSNNYWSVQFKTLLLHANSLNNALPVIKKYIYISKENCLCLCSCIMIFSVLRPYLPKVPTLVSMEMFGSPIYQEN